MDYWAKILRDLDIRDGGKSKQVRDLEGPATLVLIYLAIDEDWAYHMAPIFKAALKDAKQGFSILKNSNNLGILLSSMKEKNLLIKVADRKVRGRPRIIYKTNPKIIQTFSDGQTNPNIPNEVIDEFSKWLKYSYPSDDQKAELIKRVFSQNKGLNFSAFCYFMIIEASGWKLLSQDPTKLPYLFEDYRCKIEQEIQKSIGSEQDSRSILRGQEKDATEFIHYLFNYMQVLEKTNICHLKGILLEDWDYKG